jgi:hypothetical protein
MSHRNLEGEIRAFKKTSTALVSALAHGGDLTGIDRLAVEHNEAFERLVNCGPFTNLDDLHMLVDLKEAVDRTCRSLGEKRDQLFSQLMTSKRKRQCLKAYKKKGL